MSQSNKNTLPKTVRRRDKEVNHLRFLLKFLEKIRFEGRHHKRSGGLRQAPVSRLRRTLRGLEQSKREESTKKWGRVRN